MNEPGSAEARKSVGISLSELLPRDREKLMSNQTGGLCPSKGGIRAGP
jgi:hypothetical protein